ncbi:MAG TPA: chitobiase/beta-hexosaminidase C-terminal domain-containing protein, partial [Verrucomicrobiae bacterium]|nr:chitobiase/beta-hexosaminidase C-terminal domain-containing protein [Verrucomicrobiae bacterium]
MAVAAAYTHSLALLADGTVVAWGDDTYGKATVSQGLSSVIEIAAGTWHSMALKADGEVVAWGQTEFGQTPAPPGLSDVVAIAAGDHHSLALKRNGQLVAWGLNLYGQTSVPAGLSSVVAIAAGANHSIALKSDGTVVSWGESQVPAGLQNVASIAAGGGFSLALKNDGTVASWGSMDQSTIPTWLSSVIEVAAGDHSLSLRRDGTVVVSDGFTIGYGLPLSNVVTISAGGGYDLAVVGDRPPVAPIIIGPFSIRADSGSTAVLRVSIKGPKAAGYQWQKGGVVLTAQTNSSLTISNVHLADAGNYSVVVLGSFGIVTSRAATLHVVDRGSPEIRADGENLLGDVVRADQSTISMFTAFTNGSVFYTTDGSEPSFASERYKVPFVVTQNVTLRAIAYNLDFTQSVQNGPFEVQIAPTFMLNKVVRGQGGIQTTRNSTRFLPQSSVELRAEPAINYRFVRWEGDACGPSPGSTIVMDANKTAIAVFEYKLTYELHTSVLGDVGIVVRNTVYNYENTVVTLKAQPAPGWQFLYWQGDAEGNNSNLVVVVDRTKNVQAVCGTMVNATVGGSGTLGLSPTNEPYAYGSTVRIDARPAPGYYFATWGGAASSRANPLDFVVTNQNPTVSALFAPLPANVVNAFADIEGEGAVARSPELPFYSAGSSVTLSAIPAPGWRFVEWQGAASGTSSNATLVLDVSKTVKAVFQPLPRYTLTATTPGGGMILGNTENSYAEGAVVTLTAQPTNGWSFLGWQGDASGASATIGITLDRAKSVQAIFGTQLAFNVAGPGSLTAVPDQSAYAYGSTIRLIARPNANASFASWGNDASGSQNPLNYVVTKPKAAICVLFQSDQNTAPPEITTQPASQSVV